MAWADVRKEMVQDKGLDGAVADKIGEYVKLKGVYQSYVTTVSVLMSQLLQVELNSSRLSRRILCSPRTRPPSLESPTWPSSSSISTSTESLPRSVPAHRPVQSTSD
jgi:hypothetical protein